jgi:hypothetical protein
VVRGLALGEHDSGGALAVKVLHGPLLHLTWRLPLRLPVPAIAKAGEQVVEPMLDANCFAHVSVLPYHWSRSSGIGTRSPSIAPHFANPSENSESGRQYVSMIS